MRYNQLGRTGLFVSEICLGTMTFGALAEDATTHGTSAGNQSNKIWQAIGQVGQAEVDAMVGHAIDHGVNFIDTADIYSAGQSEEMTGQALRNLGIKRDSIVVATKCYGAMGPGPNDKGASRGHIVSAFKASLKRLGTDYVDLYQIHGSDPVTPIDETLRALDDLVRQGHVRYIGCSNWSAWQVTKALGISERRNLARFDSLQAYYSLVGRDLEREIVPMLASEQVGLMVWSPLAGGFLSGKSVDAADPIGRRTQLPFPPLDEVRGAEIVRALRPIAEAHGASVAQVSLAWLLHQPQVTSVLVGAKSVAQLDDNLGAALIRFSPDELSAIDKVSAQQPEYPRWMMDRQAPSRWPTPFNRAERSVQS